MDLDRIRTAIEAALSVSVQEIQLPGIADAAVRNAAVSSGQLQRVAAQLEQSGRSEITVSAEVELFLHFYNTDLLSTVERSEFCVNLNADENALRAVATNDKDWAMAWERGIEPIKQAYLQGIREDIWTMDPSFTEDSYTFQAAMVLRASELVGPFVDRIATFLLYPCNLVQVIAARLRESQIWDSDEVRCEAWFDPQKGAIAFLLDLMVAEGKLIGRWSEEERQFAYRYPDVRAVSHLAV